MVYKEIYGLVIEISTASGVIKLLFVCLRMGINSGILSEE